MKMWRRRRSVLILYQTPILAEGLRHLLGGDKGIVIDRVPGDEGALEKVVGQHPPRVLILETKGEERPRAMQMARSRGILLLLVNILDMTLVSSRHGRMAYSSTDDLISAVRDALRPRRGGKGNGESKKLGGKFMDKTSGPGDISRRRFLGYAIGALGAFITVVVAIPVVGNILTPVFKKKAGALPVKVGQVSEFTVGEPKSVSFVATVNDGWVQKDEARSVWVVRRGTDEFTIYNPHCTHLGCAVDWKDGNRGKAFYSPCHGGVFGIDGEVIAGPPPRRLDTLDYKVENGVLTVQYQDFRVGGSSKTAQ